ncbi:uncharacterized protein LOC111336140 [Stylophora pistillata]|uniref:uncharacterized protein LOC111336140 n=1 Tax=Stylophora pistillata TaxID=50429 RepID=UPI000C0442F8|nr:uncharacterized protein LOC111336140 [Stylophora pistillata]
MASLHQNCLLLCLGVVLSLSHLNLCFGVQGFPEEEPQCSFPGFLQDSGPKLSNREWRHWSRGKRFPYERNKPFNEFRNNRMKEEYKWVFNEGKIEILGDSYSSRTKSVFYCWRKLAPHVFIILRNDSMNETRSNVKYYSWMKFRKRGRSVVTYEQSPWRPNQTHLACNASDLLANESPLLSSVLEEIPDCPAVLRGGFQITEVDNELIGKQCLPNKDAAIMGTFESDCVGKEGLRIHLTRNTHCLMRERHLNNPFTIDLALSCFSAPWRDGNFTYFIAKRRTYTARSAFSFLASDFFCIRFRKLTNRDRDNVVLHLYNAPICTRNASDGVRSLTFHMRRGVNVGETDRPLSQITKVECNFPEKIRGIWKEISVHNGLRNVFINETSINIPPYGNFHCKQRYVFQHQAPHECSSLVTGKWPGSGRSKFFIDDYILVSNFTNGCYPRLSRLGITDIVGSDMLVYRLSQSQLIIPNGHNNDSLVYYYYNHILRLFCSSWLPYMKDPYPVWGRNIDKIIIRRHAPLRKTSCFLPSRGKGVYHFKSVNSGNQVECKGPLSRVDFACNNTLSFEVKYDPGCQTSDTVYSCIGKAWKMGDFFLVQEIKTKNISCMWFDESDKQMFLLNSPQCSDIDWGQGMDPPKDVNFEEILTFQYYSKCPVYSESRDLDYPIIIKFRNMSRNLNLMSRLQVLACLLISFTH